MPGRVKYKPEIVMDLDTLSNKIITGVIAILKFQKFFHTGSVFSGLVLRRYGSYLDSYYLMVGFRRFFGLSDVLAMFWPPLVT